MPGTERTAMEDLRAHLAEDRPRALHILFRTADHDGERGVLRFGDGARDRRIEHRDAVRSESAAERPRARRVGGTHVDDERAFAENGERLEHYFAHRGAVGQHGNEHVRCVHRLANRPAITVAGAVESAQVVAARGQMRAHRPAHGAEADERYSFDAKTSLAQRKATTAAGTPQ